MQESADVDNGQTPDDYEPNFELSHRGVIREDNWPVWHARDFRPLMTAVQPEELTEWLNRLQGAYGAENVYTGDGWSYTDERPLRHIPATGIYVDPKGLEYYAEWTAEFKARNPSTHPENDPT